MSLRVVPVSDLPDPHFMRALRPGSGSSSCELGTEDGHLDTLAERAAYVAKARAFPQGPDHPCRFHRVAWPKVAAIACSIVRASLPFDSAIAEAVRDNRLTGPEEQAIKSLLRGPQAVLYSPGRQEVGDGQHRVCALKSADVPEVPVWVQ